MNNKLEIKKRYRIKTILLATLWIAVGGATFFLLAAAIKSKPEKLCKNIEISIHGVSNNFFVDKKDILDAVTQVEGNIAGKSIGSFNLKKLEAALEGNVWIKSAELFFDNNEILQVAVEEREPIARVFAKTGQTFYIGNELEILPLSEKFSARLPVFTNFPAEKHMLTRADSNLLNDIKTISLALQKDSFSMAMIEQVDITPQYLFEMIPKLGNQLIVFGEASDAETKLGKLKLFYNQVMVKAGWNTYSVINVQYKNQVVAKRKDAEDIAADSIRTLQIMKFIAERAQQLVNDSLQIIQQDNNRNTADSSMIQQSIQRDDTIEPVVDDMPDKPAAQPAAVVAKPEPVQQQKPGEKPVQKGVGGNKTVPKPKAVMQSKN